MAEHAPPEVFNGANMATHVATADASALRDYIVCTQARIEKELKKRDQLVASTDKPATGVVGWAPYGACANHVKRYRRHLDAFNNALETKLAEEAQQQLAREKATFAAMFAKRDNATLAKFCEAIHQATETVSTRSKETATTTAKPRVKDLAGLVASIDELDFAFLQFLDADEMSQLFAQHADVLLPATSVVGKAQRRMLLNEHAKLIEHDLPEVQRCSDGDECGVDLQEM
jgi:hypothetical protein